MLTCMLCYTHPRKDIADAIDHRSIRLPFHAVEMLTCMLCYTHPRKDIADAIGHRSIRLPFHAVEMLTCMLCYKHPRKDIADAIGHRSIRLPFHAVEMLADSVRRGTVIKPYHPLTVVVDVTQSCYDLLLHTFWPCASAISRLASEVWPFELRVEAALTEKSGLDESRIF